MAKRLCLGLLLGLLFQCSVARAEPTDLELVLAVDASSSVDIGEYGLQLRGIAHAFRDPDIQGAIRSGPNKRISVNVIIWAQRGFGKLSTGWYTLATPEEADAFAARVEKMPRRQFGGTAIGEGIATALQSIKDNDLEGLRRVIDVSGDGRESEDNDKLTILLPEARARARAMGVTINGLAVVDEDPGLLDYYARNVCLGADSFALTAKTYLDFADAMRIKLFREIQYEPRLATLRSSQAAPADR